MAADGALAPSGEKYAIMDECIPDAARPGTDGKSILRVNGTYDFSPSQDRQAKEELYV